MDEDDVQKYTNSPRKMSHLHVMRKLSRTGDDSFDADEYANESYNFHDRRCSNQSMSRFNSCPQLADQDVDVRPESYERTTDDMVTTSSNTLTHDRQHVFIQGPSPLMRKKVFQENGQISDTPTPPSTPKSRHSGFSSRESLLSSPDKTAVASPLSSPRLLRRKLKQSALSKDSSTESITEQPKDEHKLPPISVDNLNTLEDTNIRKSDESLKGETIQIPRRKSRKSITPEIAETVNKCENWLQTLQIAQTDRVKSRSNIQLPPI